MLLGCSLITCNAAAAAAAAVEFWDEEDWSSTEEEEEDSAENLEAGTRCWCCCCCPGTRLDGILPSFLPSTKKKLLFRTDTHFDFTYCACTVHKYIYVFSSFFSFLSAVSFLPLFSLD